MQLDLDEHMSSRHSADGVPKIPCDVCGKRFFSVSRLQYHRRDQHEARPEDRVARCEICGFVSRGGVRNLRKHVRTKHSEGGEGAGKRFQCSHCSRYVL